MFGLSPAHILIIAIVLLLFGAKRLPELGSSLGKGLRAFKKGLDGREEDDVNARIVHNEKTAAEDSKDSSEKAFRETKS